MANLIQLMHISLDGFAAGPNGEMSWIQHDEKVFEYVSQYIAHVGTGIYGPLTFQMMEGYWPEVLHNPTSSALELRHAKWYESASKIVCSKKQNQLKNSKARLIGGDLEQDILDLKKNSEKDLMVFGSPRLTQSLAKLGLIDDYLININPVLLGNGIKMFADVSTTMLRLVSATNLGCGVMGMHYKRIV